MNALNENILTAGREPITPAQRIRADWKHLMARFTTVNLANHMLYIAFLALLAIIYIANSHRAVELQRELNTQQKILSELRWRYMDTKTRLINAGMETEIIHNSAPLGLKPLTLPAYRIEKVDDPLGSIEQEINKK